MWRYGCPRSLDWDSDGDGKIGDGVEEKEVSECVERDVRRVLRALFGHQYAHVPDDALCTRTTV